MFKLLREYRFYVTLAALILLPILAMNTSTREKTDYGFFDTAVNFVASPVQEGITFVVDRSARFLQNYIFLVNLKKDYSQTVDENRRLNNTIHNMKETEAENKRLRALLQFQDQIETAKTSAQIIARDVTSEFKLVRINKGAKQGIERGMAVVTHEGVVGKVLRVSQHFSDVITILDDLSAVDAIVQRSRAHGLLEGATDSSCLLKYALRTDDIDIGDAIVTSGLDGTYPKGIMLGTVTRVNKKSYGITQDVEVKPNVDFRKLEEVLVILKQDKHIL